jgi:HK97 family phage major capsid protein
MAQVKICELRHDRAGLVNQAKALLDKVDSEGRANLNSAEERSYNEFLNQAEALSLKISQEERSRYEAAGVIPDGGNPELYTPGDEYRTRTTPAGGRLYRQMFGAPVQSDFTSAEDFYRTVASGRHDPRLEKRAFTSGDPSGGGFLVPDELSATMMDVSLENEVVRPRATVWPMKSATLKVPAWDVGDDTNLFGGLQGSWSGEATVNTKVKGKTRLIVLNAKKLSLYTDASNELVQDGMGFEAQLQGAIMKSMAFSMDYSFLRGTGAGQPLGVLNSTSLVTVTKETNQLADTITYSNVLDMWARIHPVCANNAIWLANQTAIPQLFTMGLTLGVGAAPVFQPNGPLGYGSLMGRPLLFTEKLPVLGDAGDLLLVDLSQYYVGLRKEIYLDKTNAIGWLSDLSDYRGVIRVDGMPAWDKAITPKHGVSLSWAVSLGERA